MAFSRAGCGFDHRIIGFEASEADVVRRTRAEQHRILRHQGIAAAQVGQLHVAQVATVEGNAASLRIVEALQ